jgi:plastocyanin
MLRGLASTTPVVLLLLLGAVPVSSGGLDETVQVRDDEFDPAVVPSTTNPLLAGESIEWEWAFDVESTHDVRQLRGLFRSPLTNVPGTQYLRTFSSGKFQYECSIHGPSMSGTVRVMIFVDTAPSGLPLLRWAFPDTNTGNAFDVRFRVGDGRWRPWKTDTTKGFGVFGKDGRPVRYNPDKEYSLRARSQKGVNTPAKVSRWSPVRSLPG